ncbi:MAG: NAD(P)/FAD-dependent oxidoreductase [Bacteroidales bacterium]|jgi:phytoene dehydrogenase-like protein|nr:NAD(P)/FAD-dependent oxidoreductase [Bacteroidales bacterium]
MNKKIIIIGGGISGLTAGIYALRAGFKAEIFEFHNVAGGICTGWDRKGYHIDGCIHWLTGSKKGTDMYRVWKTCGAINDETTIYQSKYIVATIHEGKTYYLYSQLDKMEQELLSISPVDESEIKKFIESVRRCQTPPVPGGKPFEYMSFFEKMNLLFKHFKFGKVMVKSSKVSIKDYLSGFQSDVIRRMLSSIVPTELPANTLFFTLGIRTSGDGGWPMGGSYQFAQRMRGKFEELGGIMHTGTPVKNIIIRDGKAVGITLTDDSTEIPADYIVPTVDAYTVLHQLLQGKYEDTYFKERFDSPENYRFLSATLVSLGINADLKKYPEFLCLKLTHPLTINQTVYHELSMKNYSYDPEFNIDGKSLITLTIEDKEYKYWKQLKEDSPALYRQEKEKVAKAIIDELTAVYPELAGKTEMTDVATPLTFNRYCKTYQGAYMSFFPLTNIKRKRHRGLVDGIENMYLAGQWVYPNGGLPLAAMAGKFAIQRICKKNGISIDLDV